MSINKQELRARELLLKGRAIITIILIFLVFSIPGYIFLYLTNNMGGSINCEGQIYILMVLKFFISWIISFILLIILSCILSLPSYILKGNSFFYYIGILLKEILEGLNKDFNQE